MFQEDYSRNCLLDFSTRTVSGNCSTCLTGHIPGIIYLCITINAKEGTYREHLSLTHILTNKINNLVITIFKS